MFTVSANFIGNFKLGDNINHNLKVIYYMHQLMSSSEGRNSGVLRKPYIIIIGSICEAILYDFHKRMNEHTNEGVAGIADKVLNYARNKKIDQFETTSLA